MPETPASPRIRIPRLLRTHSTVESNLPNIEIQGLVPFTFTYAINQWDKFNVCRENGRLELDNSLAENKVRPAKLGARNWMFFDTAEAGVNNALLYTLMANCKLQGQDPEIYLTEVIKRLPHHATPEQAAGLPPARFAAALRAEAQAVA